MADERFVLTPMHDPNHIFDEERQMLEEINKVPEALELSERVRLIFLICRKHNVDRTVQTIQSFIKLRKEIGLEGRAATAADLHPQMAGGGSHICFPRYTDKNGQLVLYIQVAFWYPKKYSKEQMTAYMYHLFDNMMENEPIALFRRGITVVQDWKGAGLSNFDTSSKMREWTSSLTDTFPTRITNIYIINSGWVVKMVMQFAKVLFKSKIIKRIEFKKPEELEELLGSEALLHHYGGKRDWKKDLSWIPAGIEPQFDD